MCADYLHGGTTMEEIAQLEARLARLEQSNRRYRWFAILTGAATLLGAGWLHLGIASAQPRVLEAERIVLRDAAGVIRADLRVATQGDTSFNLNDERGQPVISMGGLGGFSGFTMLDGSGRERLYIQVGVDALGNDRGPRIGLVDTNGATFWQAP
jgi:hypothetical protein